MRNWYCHVEFPDGTQSVHLVPGPAPTEGAVIKMYGQEGRWFVLVVQVRQNRGDDTAAEISVRPATDEDLFVDDTW